MGKVRTPDDIKQLYRDPQIRKCVADMLAYQRSVEGLTAITNIRVIRERCEPKHVPKEPKPFLPYREGYHEEDGLVGLS